MIKKRRGKTETVRYLKRLWLSTEGGDHAQSHTHPFSELVIVNREGPRRLSFPSTAAGESPYLPLCVRRLFHIFLPKDFHAVQLGVRANGHLGGLPPSPMCGSLRALWAAAAAPWNSRRRRRRIFPLPYRVVHSGNTLACSGYFQNEREERRPRRRRSRSIRAFWGHLRVYLRIVNGTGLLHWMRLQHGKDHFIVIFVSVAEKNQLHTNIMQ